jgi:hypothetical protein
MQKNSINTKMETLKKRAYKQHCWFQKKGVHSELSGDWQYRTFNKNQNRYSSSFSAYYPTKVTKTYRKFRIMWKNSIYAHIPGTQIQKNRKI